MTVAALLEQWVSERCVEREGLRTDTRDLYADFVKWCERQGLTPPPIRAFGFTLSALGFAPFQRNRRRGWSGIALKRADGKEPERAAPPMHVAARSIREFLKVRAVVEPHNPGLLETTKAIHASYRKWAQKTGHPEIPIRDLGYAIGRIGLGLTPAEVRGDRGWRGIRLLGVLPKMETRPNMRARTCAES